ncbi:hypothetical protein BLOT_009312 [Blomia tropicalis]|nr:hypothetical protein BLOT_009312 [Blomia tropicalis]
MFDNKTGILLSQLLSEYFKSESLKVRPIHFLSPNEYFHIKIFGYNQVWITYPHHTISEYPTITGMTQLAPIIPFRMEEPLPPPPYLVETVMTENENPYENF